MQLIKRITLGIVVAGLMVSMAVPATAGSQAKAKAAKKHSCGGKWTAGGVCNFKYAGGSLQISGGYTAENLGYITVTLEAIDPQTGRRVPVISCGTAGSAFGACGSSTSDSSTVELTKGQRLFCTVQGADEGNYSCKSQKG